MTVNPFARVLASVFKFLDVGGPSILYRAQRVVIDKAADNEVFQRIVVTTNKKVKDVQDKAKSAVHDNEVMGRIHDQGGASNFAKEYFKLFKDELSKDFKKKE